MGEDYQNVLTVKNGGNASLEKVNKVFKATKPLYKLSKDDTDKWAVAFTKKLRGG